MLSPNIRAILIALLLSICPVSSLPKNHTNDQVNAAIDTGTFQKPAANFRPRFRYWIPDASINLTRMALDIADAAAVGAGGVEVLGYYLYDSSPGDFTPTDWTVYGWGTPAWKDLFDVAVKAHQDNGLIMDFAMGPNQGQGVPADPDDDGLMWDLFAYNASIPLGGSYKGQIPGWGTSGSLQAVVTGLVTKSENVSSNVSAPSLPNAQTANRIQITLAADSLTDLTSKVGANGALNITFPTNETGLEHRVFAFYLYLLVNGTKEALMQVGNYAWEDSIEIDPVVFWTQNLPERFRDARDYDITKWLPILFHQNTRVSWGSPTEPATWYITDEIDSGNSHIADFRTTLTELYGEYLTTLANWANDYLNVQFSAQVSYNLAMDMQSNIAKVNGPECESLGFNHNIDAYRQYTGPANIAGKRIISTECGANSGEVYEQTLPELLWDVKRSIAGSVNNFIFHGYPFSGDVRPRSVFNSLSLGPLTLYQYGNTTWPSYTTFPYLFSEMHGRHQPAWEFYSDMMGYTSRLMYIFQSGVPRMDLAFYQKFTTYPNVVRNYQPTDLEEADVLTYVQGWAYEYINPENMDGSNVFVQNRVLAPDRQAFKAMVIRANDSMTVSGVEKIVEYANAGLPIIISGGLPSYLASYNSSGSLYVKQALQSIISLSNVQMVPYQELAPVVSKLGITPLTKVNANRTWYTYWRHDVANKKDYVFIYNDAAAAPIGGGYSEGTVEFQSRGVPYFYDAWTGNQIKVLNYTQAGDTTIIFFRLAGNQTSIVAFHNDEKRENNWVTSASPNILAFSSDSSGISAHVGPSSFQSTCKTSDEHTYQVSQFDATALTLINWNLIVEHWDPPTNLSAIDDTIAVKSNTTHHLPKLVSWQQISGLQNVSGRGYYSTTFTWLANNVANVSGAIIDFGAIVHSIRVSINGHVLPPLDVTWARADISNYLVQGNNTVEAVVATTLINRLRPMWAELETSAIKVEGPAPKAQDYGLLFDVTVTPYKSIRLS
ncbi:hypothetical protein AOQ84DRAFT_408338 [Glonium stellatum]|uniref:Secreted protein n=1 Tax=Glonium stellatum TaxID=574774 RepID=A0A8E2EZF5_9PEZI|nr:hypothetical protein AOQ84DRAFT_408338 [Glonium stellatum]